MASDSTEAGPKVSFTEQLDNRDARWVGLYRTTYLDQKGTQRTYEFSHRLTRPKDTQIDSVGIVALLTNDPSTASTPPANGPRILLQKQFRPPVGKVCIEIPAGLLDPGESPEECALRELREETGYVGRILHRDVSAGASDHPLAMTPSPLMFNDPGSTTTSVRMIHVSVDLSDPVNAAPVPHLDEGEFIENFAVPLGELWEACRRFEAEGFAIDARVGTLAEGWELARRVWGRG